MMKTVWVLSEDGSNEVEKVFTHREDAVTYEYSLVAREYPYCDTQFVIQEVQYYENSWRGYLESIIQKTDTTSITQLQGAGVCIIIKKDRPNTITVGLLKTFLIGFSLKEVKCKQITEPE